MNPKVICFFVIIAAVHSVPQPHAAARYPAGVNPALCPNFPHCDNEILHGTAPVVAAAAYHAAPASVWNGAHAYALESAQNYDDGQWHPSYDTSAAYDYSSNDIHGVGGDKYPAGVNPAACPNYPYCDNGAIGTYAVHGAHAVHAVHGVQNGYLPAPIHNTYAAAKYPAGVNPASCPNYPYCH